MTEDKGLVPISTVLADWTEREQKKNPNRFYKAKLISVRMLQEQGISDDVIEKALHITLKPEDRTDYLPPYGKIGRILLRVLEPGETGMYKYKIEMLDHDSDSGVFWIAEGIGFDYFVDQHCEFPEPGVYVIEGIRGEYIRGDGWTTDDDENWEFERIRPATPEEIATETLP